MKLNRKWFLVIALVLSLTMATAGTLAYLTDRDSEANVFTVGNVEIDLEEDFEQGATLFPGINIEKKPTITNTGSNDAWVWAEIAIPSALNDTTSASKNAIHFNMSAASVADGLWNWWNGADYSEDAYFIRNEKIDEIDYDVYVVLYETALKPGETTEEPVIYKVYLDPHVDIDPDGNWALVNNGEVTKLDWNSEDDGNPVIYVSAYAMQTEGFANVKEAYAAYNTQWGDKGTEWGDPSAALADTWDGTADTSWYNDNDTEFVITTAEQLAGFAKLVDDGNAFDGKTVKLGKNIDLKAVNDKGETICFEPIGSYRKETPFKGTFDGQNHTISNMSQNTWALDNGYEYGDLGLGLFGKVEDAAVKNLVMDSASVSGESAICGTVAATAYGDCTFENITVKNSEVADYQYYAGGIVGWASGDHQYINCNVDASTTIAAQWGDFDNSTGGIIGGCGGSATVLFKDCKVACRIDAYNDVTSTYQWYAYRRCGMLIGNTGKTVVVDGTTYAAAPQLTCENVTVTYDDWANYTYCEFAGTSWPYVRVQAGVSNSAYSNPRYGHPTDANGNEVVDDSHVHNDGEDHFIECTFDQLYGGGQGVYGDPTHEGVTVVYNNK